MKEETKLYTNQLIRYFIYLVVVLGLTVLAFYLTVGNDGELIISTLKRANIWWVIVIFGIVILCFILRSLAIFFFARTYVKKYPFHRAFSVDQVATLYRLITPAGLGSHFMELFTFNKQRVRTSDALSVLAMYSIVYQVVLILYNSITLIVKGSLVVEIGFVNVLFGDLTQFNVPLWLLLTAGYIINLAVIGFIVFISYWDGFYKFISGPIASILAKMRVIKNNEKFQAKLVDSRDNFRNNLKHLLTNIPVLIITMVIFFIYITISYSVPYFAGLALNNQSIYANFWDSVLLSNFHQMISIIVPIPGNSISSELFFLRLFYPDNNVNRFFENKEIARAALLLWRSLMFIFPLFISCIYTIAYHPRKGIYSYDDIENQDIEGQG